MVVALLLVHVADGATEYVVLDLVDVLVGGRDARQLLSAAADLFQRGPRRRLLDRGLGRGDHAVRSDLIRDEERHLCLSDRLLLVMAELLSGLDAGSEVARADHSSREALRVAILVGLGGVDVRKPVAVRRAERVVEEESLAVGRVLGVELLLLHHELLLVSLLALVAVRLDRGAGGPVLRLVDQHAFLLVLGACVLGLGGQVWGLLHRAVGCVAFDAG